MRAHRRLVPILLSGLAAAALVAPIAACGGDDDTTPPSCAPSLPPDGDVTGHPAPFGAGLTLWALLSLNPLRDHWLGAKLLLLVLYVVLGTWALKRARSTAARAVALIAALTVFATMASIGWTRHPLGLWRFLAT